MQSVRPYAGRQSARSRRRGLTLIEIMIALMVMAIAFTSLLMSFTVGRRTAAMSCNQVNGVAAARQQMEQLIGCTWIDSKLSLGTHTIPNGSYVVTQDPTNPAIRTINLTVLWCEPLSKLTSSINLQTVVTTSLH
jgi:prepilin-type N-terminal cleavage/methylation domain-containing protein